MCQEAARGDHRLSIHHSALTSFLEDNDNPYVRAQQHTAFVKPANIWSWTSLNYFLRLENRPPKFSLDTCSTGVDSSATISESRFSNAESSPSVDSTFLPSSCTAAPCSSTPLENCLRAAVLLRRREFRTKKGSTSCFGTRLK